jgi:hypothetical protein
MEYPIPFGVENILYGLSISLVLVRKLPKFLPLDGGGFTLLHFADGEPRIAGVQQGKGGGDKI